MKEKIFNLKELKADLNSAEADDGLQRVYLGSVFSLLPSGKYYMPWACSNLEPCRYCHGSGQSSRVETCIYCDGKGKRICEPHFNREYISEQEGKVILPSDEFTCNVCHGSGQTHPECRWCGGLGSREAYLDQCWYERAEKELDSIGASLESGEGDPCDLFAVQAVDEEENQNGEEAD